MIACGQSHRLGLELGVDVERAVEDALDLVDDGFRRSAEVRDLFLDICRNWGRVAQTLRQMHEVGFLGRYLPEWDALTCLVQYDVYHKFTADQHSLIAVENLEALPALCGTAERLRKLYLLTFADMRAVGPGVMTGWQAHILWELYRGALQRLTGGRPARLTREDVADRVRTELRDDGLKRAVPGHLGMISERYLSTTPAARIAEHMRLIERLEEEPAATELFHHRDLGSSDLVI